MKEIWKSITGYEGLYEVSNLGRVKSLDYHRTGKEKILSPGVCRGYLYVALCKNGKRKNYRIHRLVGSAFIDNPDNLPCINHKDQNRGNNQLDNLEFCTYQYNNTYNNRHIKSARKISKKIGCYKDGELIKVYQATRDVDKDGFHHQHVCACCKDNRKSHGGYQWKYLD